MKHFFIETLRRYGPVSKETEQELLPYVRHCFKKKGALLTRKGQINDRLYVMEKGITRFYYYRGDKEITSWFCTENMTSFTSSSFFAHLPSDEYQEVLEDSSIYYISKKSLSKLYKTNLELSNIGRKIVEEYCLAFEERIASLHARSAKAKYTALIADFPELLQRVSLGHIASYLGVSPETLSRIRKKV